MHLFGRQVNGHCNVPGIISLKVRACPRKVYFIIRGERHLQAFVQLGDHEGSRRMRVRRAPTHSTDYMVGRPTEADNRFLSLASKIDQGTWFAPPCCICLILAPLHWQVTRKVGSRQVAGTDLAMRFQISREYSRDCVSIFSDCRLT